MGAMVFMLAVQWFYMPPLMEKKIGRDMKSHLKKQTLSRILCAIILTLLHKKSLYAYL